MPTDLPRLEDLPQRKATQVKNQWGSLVRDVRATGSIAVTQHDRVEMVVMDAATYRTMAALAEEANARHQASLARLATDFERRLASLQDPETRTRVQAVMAARGRAKRRPKAGSSF
jgi:PHD/YefM family antitoxin component YafN of YafNO toxin-antitoxin module